MPSTAVGAHRSGGLSISLLVYLFSFRTVAVLALAYAAACVFFL